MKLNFPKAIGLLAVLVFVLTLEGCATSANRLPEKNSLRFRKETAQNGLIIGSITFTEAKAKHDTYFLDLMFQNPDKKLVKKNSIWLRISPEEGFFKMKHEGGEADGGRTYLFAVERPVGDYSISSIRLVDNYNGVVVVVAESGFSIPFTSKKGEITYVGNIQFDEHKKKDAEGYAVNLVNNFAKDIALFKKYEPRTDWRMAEDRSDYVITRFVVN